VSRRRSRRVPSDVGADRDANQEEGGQTFTESERPITPVFNIAGAIGKVVGIRIVYRGDRPASYWHGGYSGRVPSDWRVTKAKAEGGPQIWGSRQLARREHKQPSRLPARFGLAPIAV
jgi:hypothetical protein